MARTEESSYGAYTGVAILLHWAIALAILALLAMGWWMTSAIEAEDEGSRRLAYQVIQLHKALGLTVLALSLFRLVWRLSHPAPPLPEGMPRWQRLASDASHFLLYGFMIGAPLTGWAMVASSPEFSSLPTSVFGLFIAPHPPVTEVAAALFALGPRETSELARGAHHLLALLGALLLAVHVAAALKHHYLDRDHVLARMTPGVAPRRPVFAPPARQAGGLARGLAGGLAVMLVAAGAALFLTAPDGPEVAVGDVKPPSAAVATAIRPKPGDAPLWRPSPEQSRIGFTGAQLGAEFTGVFERWSAEIRFDPARLDQSRVRVEIETASAQTGNAQYDGALPEKDWFAAAEHPTAVFEADRFEKGEAESAYRAFGRLTIKGTGREIELPFTLRIEGDLAEMSAKTKLDRLAYGLGASADPTGAFIAQEVGVTIELVAERGAAGE